MSAVPSLLDSIDNRIAYWAKERARFAPSGGQDYLVAVGAIRGLNEARNLIGYAPVPPVPKETT